MNVLNVKSAFWRKYHLNTFTNKAQFKVKFKRLFQRNFMYSSKILKYSIFSVILLTIPAMPWTPWSWSTSTTETDFTGSSSTSPVPSKTFIWVRHKPDHRVFLLRKSLWRFSVLQFCLLSKISLEMGKLVVVATFFWLLLKLSSNQTVLH
jgi:hypothetical protein